MKYRREIDGLRTIAVLPVILFHAGVPSFTGGFVGVDVFFVISGYLITSLIMADEVAGRFSIVNFYERRARRILPALFLMLLLTMPFAVWLMLPSDLNSYWESVVSVLTFTANFHFWHASGYFGGEAEMKPLLHTWSLAVEEQFYVFFPLVLVLVDRLNRRLVLPALLLGTVVSLALAAYLVPLKPTPAFYLLPTRAWELFIGAMLSFAPPPKRGRPGDALGLVGLAMILYAVVAFGEGTPVPSLPMLVPTLGTALVLHFARAGTPTGRLLGLPLLVGLGLVSYSAYLFHQPMFAFARLYAATQPPLAVMCLLGLLAVLAGYLSWRYVERPFRDRRMTSPRQILAFSVAAGCVLLAVGLVAPRLPLKVLPPQLAGDSVKRFDSGVCYFRNTMSEAGLQRCLATLPERWVLLAGDSHAQTLSLPLREQLAASGIGLVSFEAPGCLPIAATKQIAPGAQPYPCEEYSRQLRNYLDSDPGREVVILARWPHYLSGRPFDNGEGGVEAGTDGDIRVVDAAGRIVPGADLVDHVADELRYVSTEARLILVGPVPEAGWDVPRRVAAELRLGRTGPVSTPAALVEQRIELFRKVVNKLDKAGVTVVYPSDLVCDRQLPGRCINSIDGHTFYFDNDHPSYYYARMIARQVVAALGVD
ncbi:acyltransferase family protein [Mesorhizobium sp.]|uniref:acyltransferase family protein n=1 Tax=Mesorhizobium sp. TaxID=1871066 RepID=UPI0011FC6B02|nr:acyltransferase family protein [Mesorhizobium sp.]TIO29587.1 MAG: acyltransferase [Mesorhizobium sp.]TIP10389.1 MAG: acyltransferase [Mesorhizobium sp.]